MMRRPWRRLRRATSNRSHSPVPRASASPGSSWRVEQPTPEIIAAVEGAVAWFQAVQIKGLRVEDFTGADGKRDRRAVADPAAPDRSGPASTSWARTGRSILGRDKVIRHDLQRNRAASAAPATVLPQRLAGQRCWRRTTRAGARSTSCHEPDSLIWRRDHQSRGLPAAKPMPRGTDASPPPSAWLSLRSACFSLRPYCSFAATPKRPTPSSPPTAPANTPPLQEAISTAPMKHRPRHDPRWVILVKAGTYKRAHLRPA